MTTYMIETDLGQTTPVTDVALDVIRAIVNQVPGVMVAGELSTIQCVDGDNPTVFTPVLVYDAEPVPPLRLIGEAPSFKWDLLRHVNSAIDRALAVPVVGGAIRTTNSDIDNELEAMLNGD